MDGLILFLVGLVSGVSIVTLLNISEKGREGSKGITQEYTSLSFLAVCFIPDEVVYS